MQLEAEPAEDAITAQISLGANSENYTVYRDLDFEKADSLVYDVDVMPKDEQFAGALFWLRQDVGATQITATLIEVVSGKLKYGETCVPLETGKWNRVTAVVDFENSRYDIYLNGEPLAQFQNMSLRTDLQNPFVWRVLGYGWSPCGAIGMRAMRLARLILVWRTQRMRRCRIGHACRLLSYIGRMAAHGSKVVSTKAAL